MSVSLPWLSTPNSNLVSAMLMTRLRGVAYRGGKLCTDERGHFLETDVLIVSADLRLGRRREQRLRQPPGQLQSRRQGDPAHPPARLVVLPAGADEIAAHYRLDGQRLQPPADHPPPGQQ